MNFCKFVYALPPNPPSRQVPEYFLQQIPVQTMYIRSIKRNTDVIVAMRVSQNK